MTTEWPPEHIEILKTEKKAQRVAELTGRSLQGVYKKASKLGIKLERTTGFQQDPFRFNPNDYSKHAYGYEPSSKHPSWEGVDFSNPPKP